MGAAPEYITLEQPPAYLALEHPAAYLALESSCIPDTGASFCILGSSDFRILIYFKLI
jgi:hypothetical protein